MHTPVLLEELVNLMDIKPDGIYIDCTGGGGGHAFAVSKKLSEKGRLIVLDRDIEAVDRLKEKFKDDTRISVCHYNFADIDLAMKENSIDEVDGIYADFGVSSFQLKEKGRGFSFRSEGPIDMRMDRSLEMTAAEVVNTYTIDNLSSIIYRFGEEKFAKKIAIEISKRRAIKKFTTTYELSEVIKNAIPKKFHKKGIHPATKTFLGLRIFVNKELEAIEELMSKIASLLKKEGRFGAISFHSLEDRIVKDYLNNYAKDCVCPPNLPVCVCEKKAEFKIITKKPIIPAGKEIEENPLSRSAKLRIAERL